MTLSPGTRLGPYEIVSPLGAGGMGEVYRAKDTRLARDVAVKVLPEGFLEGQERKARFEREAKLLAALNHPNIAAIHSFEEISGRHILVMELLEGTTLRDRLDSGSIPPKEAVDYALQIAKGLSAGHEKGIVHRDLKPENLFVSKDGHLKILDFGLAKRIEREETGDETGAPTESKHTEPGTVMGTVAYMSPEQVRGLPVDHRSDIFSFGTILYELLSGKKAFKKDTASDTMAAIMRDEPPEFSESGRNIPPALDRVVKHCLEKDRENRFQSTKDIAFALSEVSAPAPPGRPPDSEARAARLPLAWIAAGVLVLGLVSLLVLRAQRSRPAAAPLPSSAKLTQITDSLGLDLYPSFSPDGAQIAYCSDRGGGFEIFVRQLAAGGREIQITSDSQDNLQPAWSPNGREIAFASRGRPGIWVLPALGGTPRRLTEFGSRPAWSPDGTTIAFQSAGLSDVSASGAATGFVSSLFLVPVAGGTPVPLTRPGSPGGGHGAPTFSPDGKTIVFSTWNGNETGGIWSVSRFDGSLERVSSSKGKTPRLGWCYDPVYSPRGDRIYFAATSGATWMNASLWTARAPSSAGAPWGEPEPVTSGGSASLRHIAVSPDGSSLAYDALSSASNLWSLPVDVRSAAPAADPRPLTRATGCRNSAPAFSPDGSRIAFISCRAGSVAGVWVMTADGQNARPLTDDPEGQAIAGWFPDGERIAFMSAQEGPVALRSVALSDGSEKQLLPKAAGAPFPHLSPDGESLAFTSRKLAGVFNVWVAPLDGGAPRQVTFDREGAGWARWSPDGKSLAVELQRGPDTQIAIVSALGGSPIVVTHGKGQSWPDDWSPDGERIAFAGQRDGIWNVYWVSRHGGPEHRLTNYSSRNSFVRYPAWSPRGDQIVYEYSETTGNIWLMDLPR